LSEYISLHKDFYLTLVRKISSPKVEILLGPKKKIYSVPKDLLCYYSNYFDRCFNGGFMEATHQMLILEEDAIADFELLLDYILTGSIAAHFDQSQSDEAALNKCMTFIEYADKYDVADVGLAVYDALMKILHCNGSVVLKPTHIEIVYAAFPKGHRLRTLIASTAMKAVFGNERLYKQQVQDVDGFAAEVILQAQVPGRGFLLRPLPPPPFDYKLRPWA
jgi:hypothetical protein